MAIQKKSLISNTPAAKSSKKQTAKVSNPANGAKMATAMKTTMRTTMKTTMAAKMVNARTFV